MIKLFVVIPCHNEARYVAATLAALAAQTDLDFDLILVDNASTDGSRSTFEASRRAHAAMRWRCIDEPQKGTGCAVDTGFRDAIAAGATHIARTDADCLPRADWIASIKRAFGEGVELIAGAVHFRVDDCRLGLVQRASLACVAAIMSAIAPLLSHNRCATYKARYVMASGGNIATTAALYVASGGFPRIRLEDDNEDRVFMNRARRISANIRRDRRVVVAQSARRVVRYGIRNSVLWYWDRRYRPEQVDVR